MDAAAPTPRLSLTVSLADSRHPQDDIDTWSDVERPHDFQPVQDRLAARLGEAMTFRFELDIEHEILWSGADTERLTRYSAEAVARFDEPGEHVVRAEIFSLSGRLIATLSAFVDVTTTVAGLPPLCHTDSAV